MKIAHPYQTRVYQFGPKRGEAWGSFYTKEFYTKNTDEKEGTGWLCEKRYLSAQLCHIPEMILH